MRRDQLDLVNFSVWMFLHFEVAPSDFAAAVADLTIPVDLVVTLETKVTATAGAAAAAVVIFVIVGVWEVGVVAVDSAALFVEVVLGSKVILVCLSFLESERKLLIAGSVLEFVPAFALGLSDVDDFLEVILARM